MNVPAFGMEALIVDPTIRSSVSLRNLFPQSQIVGADDICCTSCDQHPESIQRDWVFAAGVAHWSEPAYEVVQAINNGAKAILTEQLLPSSVPQCIVPDVREAYARLCQVTAGRPFEKILTIGIVGTHGKTTAALMVASMLKRIGKSVAYRTTLGACNGKDSGLTVESECDAQDLAKWLGESVENNTPAAVLEISDDMLLSHASSGIEFDVLLFTSMRKSQRTDSLQNRGLESAMCRILGQLKSHGMVVYNADDARLNRWMQRHEPNSIGYGLDASAHVKGRRMQALEGEQSMMISAGNCVMPLTSTIVGDHNARHMLGAIAVGYSFGLELFEVVQGVERLQRLPGRLQRVPSEGTVDVYVDAADQADRLAVALHSLARDGAPITCVAEIPDAATPEQLAAYGRVLERAAGRVILTQSRRSVRFGQRATWQVLDGCERPASIQIVPNRATAIELALRGARPGEKILLAGWGANRWTNDQARSACCDVEVATKLLADIASQPRIKVKVAIVPTLRIYGDRAA